VKKLFWIVLALVIGSLSLAAQAPVEIRVGQPYTVAWDYTDNPLSPAQGFRLEVNETQVGGDIPLGTLQTTLTAPGGCGPLTIRVAAFNANGSSYSTPLNVNVVGCPPNAPTNLRIVIVVTQEADGSFKMRIEHVEVK
jgi:ketosteroid isomerase-like protein